MAGGRGIAAVAMVALAFGVSIAGAAAPPLRIAVTIDDLPWSGPAPPGESERSGLVRIAATLRVHGAPATGFAVCDRAEPDDPALTEWLAWRFDLGNHSAAHRDLSSTPVADWIGDVERCQRYLDGIGAAGRFFRYPMLHEGHDAATRRTAREGIAALGLRNAPVTVDTSEWILAAAYREALAREDDAARLALGRALVEHVLAALDHADQVARRKTGRSVPHVLLLHANALVADHLDVLLLALRERGVTFVGLDEALADPVFARADGYVGPRGLSWLYRMEPASPADAAWDEAEEERLRARFADLLASTEPTAEGPAAPARPSARPLVPPSLAAAVELAGRSERMRSLLVMHRGELVAEAYFHGAGPETAANLKSVTKSLTAALVGVGLEQGWLASLDDPLSRYLPDRFGNDASPRAPTLRQLLTMTSGLAPVAYDEYQQADDALGALLASPAASPSSGFVYDTPVLDLLVAAIERASGTDVESLANRELLGPLGGRVAHWRRNGNGIPMGGNDAYLLPRDLIRLGELFRRGGTWEGRRLLPAAFVTAATSPLVPTGEPTINHGTLPVRGYGLLWWALAVAGDDDVFAALGHGGQELLVFPGRELVVLMTSRWPGPSSSDHYRHLLRVIEEGILPAFPGENVGRAATVQHRAR